MVHADRVLEDGQLIAIFFEALGRRADSDDLARVYRDGAARDSEMISPTVPE
jgi:hypothetical protein